MEKADSDLPEFSFDECTAAIAALRQAHELIAADRMRFICRALAPKPFSDSKVTILLVDLISRRIAGKNTLENWVRDYIPGGRDLDDKDPEAFRDEMRAYRLRWVEALIEEIHEYQERLCFLD